MKVLVTGGNGFIGSYVIKELRSRGFYVKSFDIIQPSELIEGVEYTFGTILDTFSLCECLKGCDAIFHLAAILGVRRTEKQLLKCMTINIQGTINVLEACVRSKVPYILIASSSEVYGDLHTDKIKEDSHFNPKSGYAISKLASEKYLNGFSNDYGLQYNIVRFFNIYGPKQVAEFVLPRFVKMVQKGIPPEIYGDGNQVRSFCYITDACRAIVDVFLNKNLRNETFNIGNDKEPITIKDLAEKVLTIAKSNLIPKFIPFAESDRNTGREIYYRVPDISKLKNAINYTPEVMIDQGIQYIIDGGEIAESWIDTITDKKG